MGEWLARLGLAKYAGIFAAAEIDLDVLRDLTEADLEKLGIPLGPRKKLLKAASALLGQTPDLILPADAVPAHGLTSVRTEAERRQLTVMFIDLVGSTALSARLDPEDMRLVIRAYQDACSGAIARYDGFVAKSMGDPLCARVGIATGLVVVGDLIGEGSAQEQAVVGDTPNLAARLQDLAEAGTIVIAGSTRHVYDRAVGCKHRKQNLGQEVWTPEQHTHVGVKELFGRVLEAICRKPALLRDSRRKRPSTRYPALRSPRP
jgi:class 3 adenylate cyclase